MKLAGGPTAPEIIAVSLQKLGIRPGETAADIGCGTGSVTKEMAKTAGYVYAIDRRKEAIECTKETCAGTNIEIIRAEALEFLASSPRHIDCAFLGGSRDMEQIITHLVSNATRSIVVNAVLLETAAGAIHTMKQLGIFKDAAHIQISHSYELTGRTMFKPANPIYIIHGEQQC